MRNEETKDRRKVKKITVKEEKGDEMMEGRINCIVTEKENKRERKEN